ncbi:hypothetical protein MKX03_036515, partial [Papaver bracteatum]
NISEMLVKLGSLMSTDFLKIRLLVIRKIMPNQDDIETDRLEREIRKSIIGLIKKREEKVNRDELEGGYRSDYLGMLIKAYQESDDNKKISIDDLIDECKTFYVAGHKTTSSLLTWA